MPWWCSPCSTVLDGEDIHGTVVRLGYVKLGLVVLPFSTLLDGEDIHGAVVRLC